MNMLSPVRSVPIGEVATLNPKGPTPGLLEGGRVLDFLPMADLSEDGTMTVSAQRPYAEVAKGYTAFRHGDVLLAKITPCFENNKIGLADVRTEWAFGSTEFHVIRPGKDVDARYLLHFLRQDTIRGVGEKRMTGSGGQRRVPKSFLEELPIPLPPLPEQKRIAAILDQADALRRLRRRALDRLNTLGQAIFQEMFGDPVANERGFPTLALDQVASFVSGATPAKANPAFWGGGIPWVTPKDMKRSVVSSSEDSISPAALVSSPLKMITAGTPLIVVRGMILAHTIPMALSGTDCTINQDMKAIRFGDQIMPEFGLYCLHAQHGSMLQRIDTAAHGTRRFDMSRLGETPILVAPSDEQARFVAALGCTRELASHAAQAQGQADTLFSSLQHRAFTGQL